MESNDKALLIAVIAAFSMIWLWSGHQAEIKALRQERDQLAWELQQTRRDYETYQKGVLSR